MIHAYRNLITIGEYPKFKGRQGLDYRGRKFVILVNPVMQYGEGTDDQERFIVVVLPQICTKCDDLQRL